MEKSWVLCLAGHPCLQRIALAVSEENPCTGVKHGQSQGSDISPKGDNDFY